MHTSWIGIRRAAVIPARPGGFPVPADWPDQVAQKLFYDPGPNGDDFSVRAYFEAISYGKAQFEADILPEAVVTMSTCGNMTDEAIRSMPAGHTYERACVVFPPNLQNAACDGWAFGYGSLFPGTSNLRGWCYVSMDIRPRPAAGSTVLGTWGMELLHVFTYFGDLYFPINRCQPTPGRFDEMDCACGTHPSAVTKLHMGWLTAAEVPVVSRQENQYTLHALALRLPPPPGRIVGLRIPAIGDPSPAHYFLVECRLPVDRFDRASPGFSAGIPSNGVVVYEVNEQSPTGFWMCLRTPNALAAGQRYENAAEKLVVEASADTWGGMRVVVRSTEPAKPAEPAECAAIREQIATLEQDRALAADDLGAAVGQAEREIARRELTRIEGDLRSVEQRARELGCEPA